MSTGRAKSTHEDKARSAAVLCAMAPGLRRAYERIRELLANATKHEARCRHEVGLLVSEIKRDPGKYGSRAIEQLAHALGTNVHTLYRCASVAECWPLVELEAIHERVNGHGQPLSWSHLVLISGVGSPGHRAELVACALRDALSVRQLAAILDAPPSDRASSLAVLHRLVRTAERWSRTATEMQRELLAEVDGARTGDSDAARLIERAIAAQEELRSVLQQQLQRLRGEKARLARGEHHGAPPMLAGVRSP